MRWLNADDVQSDIGAGMFLAIWRPVIVFMIVIFIILLAIKLMFNP